MKNKAVYTIIYAPGRYYTTDKDGNVLECDNGLNKYNASKEEISTWKITGIVKKLPFNNEGERLSLEEASEIKDLCFKNGKPAYWITDIDHGTRRLHGGTINSDLRVYKV